MSKVLSVIIPTRNVMKTGKLKQIFRGLSEISDMGLVEVMVCDFESNDGLNEFVADYDFVKLIDCPEGGTANQINFGLSQATGRYALIHHARSVVSDYDGVLGLCADGKLDWMYFPIQFDHNHWFLKWIVGFGSTYIRPSLGGAVYWDQCNVVNRGVVDEVGGVPVMDLMEDTEFSSRLRGIGLNPKLVRSISVVTSAHRFLKNGIYTHFWRNAYIKTAHRFGWKSVEELNEMYK